MVFIEWVDSQNVPGWSRGDPSEEPLLCKSVGWLTYLGKEATSLTGHLSVEEPEYHYGEMTIPTRAILKILVLDEPDTIS